MVQIIKATIEHTDLIVELGKQTFLESHGHCASKEDVHSFILKTYNKKAISKEFENAKVQYYILYYNGKAAGFSKIEINNSNKNVDDLNITKLDRIYILKEFYDLKLGSKLFDFNIQLSKKQQQKGIWLATWVENHRAIKFYMKKGFKIVGEYSYKIARTHSNPNHIMYLKYS